MYDTDNNNICNMCMYNVWDSFVCLFNVLLFIGLGLRLRLGLELMGLLFGD